MIAAILVDPELSKFVLLSCIIISVGFILKVLKQPSIVSYIIVGVLVGPFGLEFITNEALISNLGSLGLVLLLFFIGMEIHLPDLIASWKVSVIGTLMQILISILGIWLLSFYFGWDLKQVIVLGFVISISSTAVIVKLLQERDELQSVTGQNVLGILLAQDVLIVPMFIIIGYLQGEVPETKVVIKQLIGGAIIVSIFIFLFRSKRPRIPFEKYIIRDYELQVFVAFSFCFGFSLFTAYFGLSSALGAFVGGLFLSCVRSTKWVHDSLNAFKVMFVALFFVSVGLLIDLEFLVTNLGIIGLLVLLVFIANNAINTVILKLFGYSWKQSFYAGALLSQIGEFSFILGSTAFYAGIIEAYIYQLIISTIAISLLLSPFWISFSQRVFHIGNKYIPGNLKNKF